MKVRLVPLKEIMECPHHSLDPEHYIPRHKTEDCKREKALKTALTEQDHKEIIANIIEKQLGIRPDDVYRYPTEDEIPIEAYFINPTKEQTDKIFDYARERHKGSAEYIEKGTTDGEPIVLLRYCIPIPKIVEDENGTLYVMEEVE